MKAYKGSVAALLGRVQETVRAHGLLSPGDRVVVAVSGGPDSVALLHVLREVGGTWGLELAVAHLHHGLRGEDADGDLAFVEGMAHDLDAPFFGRRLPQGALRAKKGSLQEIARRARYAFLEEVRAQWGGQRIALGHQADDQAETVLAALIRGAGTHGLGGMPYNRGVLVRPLLDVARDEILGYLEARGLCFREDPTNRDPAYLRARVRGELLPLLRQRFSPQMDALLRRTARICGADDACLEAQTQVVLEEAARLAPGRVEIRADLYASQPQAIRWRLLRRAYVHVRGDARRLSFSHLAAMERAALSSGDERRVHLPHRVHCVAGGGTLLMTTAEALRASPWRHPVSVPGETRIPEAGLLVRWEIADGLREAATEPGAAAVFLNLDAVRGPLILRGPEPGDRLRPLGLGGTRKLQDLLVDAKVPRRDRWRVPVLVDDQGPLWVIGHRVDERARIEPVTSRILKAMAQPAERLPI